METKSLELFYADADGYPGRRITEGDKLNIGEFDVSLGTKFDFFIRNPIHNAIIDISDLHLNGFPTNVSFSAPDEIMPFETVKATVTIKKKELEEFDVMTPDGLESYTDMVKQLQEELKKPMEIVGRLEGKTPTMGVNIIRDDKQTRYGW